MQTHDHWQKVEEIFHAAPPSIAWAGSESVAPGYFPAHILLCVHWYFGRSETERWSAQTSVKRRR